MNKMYDVDSLVLYDFAGMVIVCDAPSIIK